MLFISSFCLRFPYWSSNCYKCMRKQRIFSRLKPGHKNPIKFFTEGPDKTTVTLLNKEMDSLMINSFSQVGFRLNNGLMVLGPMAIFPRSVLSWNIQSLEDINEDTLSLFYMLEPKLDILLIGCGDPGNTVPTSIRKFVHSKKIGLEVLPTEQACSTFNFLNSERRYVAAAMIPPTILQIMDDDVVLTKARYKRIYETDDMLQNL